jgi:hypothetical protein
MSKWEPGTCRGCGERVHRRTKGGKWYQYCDDCRRTEPDDDSLVDEEAWLKRRREITARFTALDAREEAPAPEVPETYTREEHERDRTVAFDRQMEELKPRQRGIDYTNPDPNNPSYRASFGVQGATSPLLARQPEQGNPLDALLGPTGLDDQF